MVPSLQGPLEQPPCLITARRLPAEKRAVVASADPPSVQMPPLAGSMRLRNDKIQASVLGSYEWCCSCRWCKQMCRCLLGRNRIQIKGS